jgi:TPR repeat protein
MFNKMRWSVAAGILALSGIFSMAHAAGATDMGKSFDAATGGDFKQAVSIWEELAAEGDPQAQFNLGLMYHGGLGLPRNEAQAVKLYQKAAEGGYSAAQVYLVVGYEEGWFGLPKDSSKAYYWRGMLNSAQK